MRFDPRNKPWQISATVGSPTVGVYGLDFIRRYNRELFEVNRVRLVIFGTLAETDPDYIEYRCMFRRPDCRSAP